jgi:hypothetical protein
LFGALLAGAAWWFVVSGDLALSNARRVVPVLLDLCAIPPV